MSAQDKIPAEVHSDDRVFEINFDAAEWFRQASEQNIIDLAACGWGGDYAADDVAEHYQGRHAEIDNMFAYLHALRGKRNAPGFECHVDSGAAILWLKKHRPGMDTSELNAEATQRDQPKSKSPAVKG